MIDATPGQSEKPKVLLFDLQMSKQAEDHLKTCKDCQDRYKQVMKKMYVITLHISQETKQNALPTA